MLNSRRGVIRRILLVTIVALIVLGGLASLLLRPAGSASNSSGAEVWTCSMHPQVRMDHPGRCPICGMQLIPVSKLPSARDDLETRAGLESESVQRPELFKEIRAVGKLDYSERQVAYITSRVDGRVDRLFVDFTGVEVKKGDHLVSIYSPDLLATQSEFLNAVRSEQDSRVRPGGAGASGLSSAARRRLELWGITPQQIDELLRTGAPEDHLVIYAPLGGTVIEKNVRVGQYLNTGDEVYRIADLDPIWLYLNIYEFDVSWVRLGQTVDVQFEAFPGEKFNGSIMFIDPFLDDATRTIRVRVNIKNPHRLLKPQMFATATINVKLRPDGSPEPTGLEGMFVCPMHPEVVQREPGKCSICEMPLEKVPERRVRVAGRGVTDEDSTEKADVLEETPAEPESDENESTSNKGVLAIPVSAVLDTGRRRITYRLTNGAYELVDLKVGPRAHSLDESGKRREFFVVLDGIKEGDLVVSQGGFLLDSQRQIEGMPSLLYPTGQTGTALHSGHGGMGSGGGATPSPNSKETPSGHKH